MLTGLPGRWTFANTNVLPLRADSTACIKLSSAKLGNGRRHSYGWSFNDSSVPLAELRVFCCAQMFEPRCVCAMVLRAVGQLSPQSSEWVLPI